MTEVLHQDRRFEIEPTQYEDAVGIGDAHLQSWQETYPNAEYGVTNEWIKDEFHFLVEDGIGENGRLNGITFRREVIQKNDPDTLYKVVKDEQGVPLKAYVKGMTNVSLTAEINRCP